MNIVSKTAFMLSFAGAFATGFIVAMPTAALAEIAGRCTGVVAIGSDPLDAARIAAGGTNNFLNATVEANAFGKIEWSCESPAGTVHGTATCEAGGSDPFVIANIDADGTVRIDC